MEIAAQSAIQNEGPAARHWRGLVERRARQMDAAYAALNRTSADYWARRMGNRPSMLRRTANADDPIVEAILAYKGTAETLLDIGAGAGRYTLALAPYFRSIIAVEPDAAMLPRLQEAIREAGVTNIEVVDATWQDANVDRADLVLCAHVLYPIADVAPFIQKLDAHACRACFIALRDVIPEPEPLGRLWEQFHHEPRYLQPGYLEAYALIYELGIRANVRVSKVSGPSWSFYDLDSAVDSAREHLILPESPEIDAALLRELEASLLQDGELLRLPGEETYSAVIWWEATE
jgi:SAM-dependent methyltransferase